MGGQHKKRAARKAPKALAKQPKRTAAWQFDAPRHRACQSQAAQPPLMRHRVHETTNPPSESQPDGYGDTPGQARARTAGREQTACEGRRRTEWDEQQGIPPSNGARTRRDSV